MQRPKLHKVKIPRIRKKSPPGAVPGVLPMEQPKQPTQLTLIQYSDTDLIERTASQLDALDFNVGPESVTWLHVEGSSDTRLLEELGQRFHLHKLALEDVINAHQRAKVERYEDHTYIVLRTLHGAEAAGSEQVNIFLCDHLVVTIQEHKAEWTPPVRERVRQKKGHIRSLGAGYMAYAIIDVIVDTYFPVLERFADRLDELEDRLMVNNQASSLANSHEIQRDLLMVRRIVWAHRELVYGLTRETPKAMDGDIAPYLRDCYDHTMQQLDLVDAYRDVAANLINLSFSLLNFRSNEVMKVLSVVATIFIPLTFITGVYGMNFNHNVSPFNMPELTWRYGYFAVLLLMAGIATGLIVFFHRKGWFR